MLHFSSVHASRHRFSALNCAPKVLSINFSVKHDDDNKFIRRRKWFSRAAPISFECSAPDQATGCCLSGALIERPFIRTLFFRSDALLSVGRSSSGAAPARSSAFLALRPSILDSPMYLSRHSGPRSALSIVTAFPWFNAPFFYRVRFPMSSILAGYSL